MKDTNYFYNDQKITFRDEDGTLSVNLTMMVKAFPGKRLDHFLKSPQTKQFIKELQAMYPEKRILTAKPGRYGYTWGHELLALKLAAYLSPRFELWVLNKTRDLLNNGVAVLDDQTAKQLEVSNDRIEGLEKRIAILENPVQTPYEVPLDELHDLKYVEDQLGIGHNTLLEILRRLKQIYQIHDRKGRDRGHKPESKPKKCGWIHGYTLTNRIDGTDRPYYHIEMYERGLQALERKINDMLIVINQEALIVKGVDKLAEIGEQQPTLPLVFPGQSEKDAEWIEREIKPAGM